MAALGAAFLSDALGEAWVAAGLLFFVVLAYQGVRLGRSTHLVDMAGQDQRAVYTAVSNTLVGVVLVLTGAFGPVSEVIGLSGLFATFAVACVGAFVVGRGLEEVQSTQA